MPMERNIATTIGINVAATMVFGRTPERAALTRNQTRICLDVLVPTPSSEARPILRSSPHRVQTLVRMFAPNSRRIVS